MRSFVLPFLMVFYFALLRADDDLDIKIYEIFMKAPTTAKSVDSTRRTTPSRELKEKVDSIFGTPSPRQTTLNSESEIFLNDVSTSSPTWGSTPSQELKKAINSLFTMPTTASSVDPPHPESSSLLPEKCVCVPFYQCKNGTLNTNGEGLLDIRISGESCSNKEYFCCKLPAITSEPVTTTKGKTETPWGCGYRKPGIGNKIMGEEDDVATFAEFPWMVAILVESLPDNPDRKTVYQCGGALIHPRAVLTAAHCVVGKDTKFKVRAGVLDAQNMLESPLPHQQRDLETITLHPKYYPGALYNDVAVLITETPFEITENVNVICLPEQNYSTTDTRCLLSGWGKNGFRKKGKYQLELKKVDLPVVERDTCQNQLRKTRLGRHFHLHRSFMCAGGEEGKDACKGDGGSPLVCPMPDQEDRFYHAGIVSWGIGCGDNEVPGIYANVASFREWIDEQMRHHNLDSRSYEY